MHVGVCIFNTGYAIRIEELAKAAEERGFESLWVPEHTHIPTSRRSPFGSGGELPEEYKHTLDPFVALATAAAVTTRLKVGTGICLVIERDPIIMAKDVAQFKGEFVSFDPIWCWPKPVQKPNPPVLLGGEGPLTLQRVVEFCDGWFPRARNEAAVFSGMKELRERATKAGRDPKTLTVSVFGASGDPAPLERFREAGVTRAILRLPSEGRDKVLGLLDQWAPLVTKLAH